MLKFEIGKKYFHKFISDSSCTAVYEVLSRTDKTLTVKLDGEIIRKRIGVFLGHEFIYPLGKYSMCPTLRAINEVKEN